MREHQSRPDPRRRRLLGTAGGLALLSTLGQTLAQPGPRTVKIVCGYAAGGTSDLLCRQVAARMPPEFASSVIVENKPGALAQLSVTHVKQQPPDGSHILQVASVLFTLFPYVYKSLPYDPVADFVPLTAGCQVEYGYAVGPMVPASIRTVPEYVAWTRSERARATFATAGILPTTVGSLLGKLTGGQLVPVQYKGGAPAVQDTMAANVPAVITTVGDLLPYLGERLRILAITSDRRNALLPDVPTFAEQGVAGMVAKTYFSFFVHAATPPGLVASQSTALRSALGQKEVTEALARVAMEVLPLGPRESAELLAADSARWKSIIKRIGQQPI